MPKNIKTYQTPKYTIKIDRDQCLGCGTCIALAPKTFAHDKHQKAIVKPNKHDNPNTILTAAQTCPTTAIIITDKKTGKKLWPK